MLRIFRRVDFIVNDRLNINNACHGISMRIFISFELRCRPRWLWTRILSRWRWRIKFKTLLQRRFLIRQMGFVGSIKSG
jgi:hypothetical protein